MEISNHGIFPIYMALLVDRQIKITPNTKYAENAELPGDGTYRYSQFDPVEARSRSKEYYPRSRRPVEAYKLLLGELPQIDAKKMSVLLPVLEQIKKLGE